MLRPRDIEPPARDWPLWGRVTGVVVIGLALAALATGMI